jgi:hypothetical protein
MAGLIYGLLGWRLVRFLAVVDAVVVGVLGVMLNKSHSFGSMKAPPRHSDMCSYSGCRFSHSGCRMAVVTMGGGIGLVVQMVLGEGVRNVTLHARHRRRGFAMGMHLTLHRHSAVVVTGVHGGGWWLLVWC